MIDILFLVICFLLGLDLFIVIRLEKIHLALRVLIDIYGYELLKDGKNINDVKDIEKFLKLKV